MATATHIAALSATPSLAVQPRTEADVSGSTLLKLIPYAYTALSLAVSVLSYSLAITRLVLSPLPILLYIIAPITTFIDVTATLFIRFPYRTFLYLADALYPLYVLLGVACITGWLFGYGGRLIIGAVVNSIVESPSVGPLERVEARRKDIKPRGRQEVKFQESRR